MATTLDAEYRITLPYIIDGLQHEFHAYCKVPDPSAPTLSITNRSGGTHAWYLAPRRLWTIFKDMCDGTPGTAILSQRLGASWVPLATDLPAGAATGSNAPARQITYVLRAADFTKVRVVFLESGVATFPYHTTTDAVFGGATAVMAKAWDENFTDLLDPYNWQVSRSNEFLASSPFVGWTTDLNDKLRRARGLV